MIATKIICSNILKLFNMAYCTKKLNVTLILAAAIFVCFELIYPQICRSTICETVALSCEIWPLQAYSVSALSTLKVTMSLKK